MVDWIFGFYSTSTFEWYQFLRDDHKTYRTISDCFFSTETTIERPHIFTYACMSWPCPTSSENKDSVLAGCHDNAPPEDIGPPCLQAFFPPHLTANLTFELPLIQSKWRRACHQCPSLLLAMLPYLDSKEGGEPEKVSHGVRHEVVIDFVMWQVNNY